jgi:hypothetical protein
VLAATRVRLSPAVANDLAREAMLEKPRDGIDALELITLVERIDQPYGAIALRCNQRELVRARWVMVESFDA